MATINISTMKDCEINWDKVQRDLSFLRQLIDLAKKMNWRVVVSGGYGLDSQLGQITRTHGDLDIVIYGEGGREAATIAITDLMKSKLDSPQISIKKEDFFENIDVKSIGFYANTYYVQTAENPFHNLSRVTMSNGQIITNSEDRFPPPVAGFFDDLKVEAQNPNTHLADILYKRRTKPHKPSHDQDILNLRLLTDQAKVKMILELS